MVRIRFQGDHERLLLGHRVAADQSAQTGKQPAARPRERFAVALKEDEAM
jgi:hypothetical protein